MKEPARGFAEALAVARYMGAEYRANPGSSRRDYYDDIAWYFGIDGDDAWHKVPAEQKLELVKAFNGGAAAERKHQQGVR